MQNAELTQHLVLLEERMAELEAHLSAIEPMLLRIESALPVPSALSLVAARLGGIDKQLAARVTTAEIRQSFEDVFLTYGLVQQLKEVYTTQRDELAALVVIAGQLLQQEKEYGAQGADERETIRQLLLQLRELGRKHVSGLADLERAFSWREGDVDRRKAG